LYCCSGFGFVRALNWNRGLNKPDAVRGSPRFDCFMASLAGFRIAELCLLVGLCRANEVQTVSWVGPSCSLTHNCGCFFFFGQRCMSIAVFMRAQVQMRTTARVHWSVHWMLRILPFVRSRSFKKTLHLGTNTYNFLCHPFLKSPSNTLLYFVIEGILKKSRQLKKKKYSDDVCTHELDSIKQFLLKSWFTF
jgi:hypothetical protein